MNDHIFLQKRDEEILRMRECNQRISSGFTKKTLKQALDDAKKVKEQALKNAKKAMDDAFKKYGQPRKRTKIKSNRY